MQPKPIHVLIALCFSYLPYSFSFGINMPVNNQSDMENALQTANTGDEIILQNDMTFSSPYNADLANSTTNIIISNTGSVNLNGHFDPTTVDNYRLLNGTAASTISFKNTELLTIQGFGIVEPTNTNLQGKGGAIYAQGNLDFEGKYNFSNNTVLGGNSLGTDATHSTQGGAISTENNSDLTFNDGIFSFTGNRALGGAAIANAIQISRTNNSGVGGAVNADRNLTFTQGNYQFIQNTATGGNATTTGTGGMAEANDSALGGAIFTTFVIKFQDGNYLFDGNKVIGGNADNSGGKADAHYSARGGAIYSNNYADFNNGTYQFINNQAIGGDALNQVSGGTADTSQSGLGGAIAATSNLNFLDGQYTFSNNQAIGGKAEQPLSGASNSDISGLGGAVYIQQGDINFNATQGNFIRFLNNTATTTNDSDISSGRGGAIFIDARTDNVNHILHASGDGQIFFEGNTHNPGNSGLTANAIYFGNTLIGSGTKNITLNIDTVNTDSSVIMKDPMASQEDNLQGKSGQTYDNINLIINKKGTGLWQLGSVSQMNSATAVNINTGTFELLQDGQLNLKNTTTGSFNTATGSTFASYVPKINGQTWINAKDIIMDGATNFSLTSGISSLSAGDYHYQKVLYSSNSLAINGSAGGSLVDNGGTYTATLQGMNDGTADLYITGIKSLNNLYDIDDIIDIWRQNPDLDDHYRGPLDDLYAGNYTPEYLEQLKVLAQQLYGREQLNGMMILNDNVQTFRNISAHRLSGGINGNTRVANNSYQNRPILVASNGSSAGLFNREEREPNSLWFSLNHRWAKQDDHNKTNGYKYTPSTITIGYDRSLDNWLVGAALQYDDGKAKSNNSNRIEITSKDYLVGLYGGYHTDRWYVNGGLQYGTADNTSKSNFDFMGRTARTQGDYNINIWGANIETGIEYDVDGWNITPHIGLDYASIKQDEFTETGDRNFTRHFNSAKQNIIEIPVGVQLSKDFQLSNGFNLIPTLDLSYAFNAGDTDASTTANFTDVPHLPFLVKGLDRGRNIYRGKLGLSAQINSSLDISGSYGIELRDNFDSQFINLQLRYWF